MCLLHNLSLPHPNGDARYIWQRGLRNGKWTDSVATHNLRSGKASTLEAMIEHGECRVIYEPSALVAIE